MNQIAEKETCTECKKVMTPLIPKSNPKSAEWYCFDCRKSIRMIKPGEAAYWSDS